MDLKFPGLGESATVPDILKMSPAAGKVLMELHEAVMRGESSPLTEGQRELIAAYVSGLNACRYCVGVHSEAAKAYGVDSDAVDNMLETLDGFEPDMRPLMQVARKLTEEPASLTAQDAWQVYDAGWDEKALHDTIMVVCTFNFMNRLLEGHGVHGNEAMYKQRGAMLKQYGYQPLVRLLMPAKGTHESES